MIPSFIARDTLVEAPIEAVWSLITDPAQIAAWFAEEAEIDLRAGGEGVLTFSSTGAHPLTVEAVDPPHTFAYRWQATTPDQPRERFATRVEFTLSEEAGGTRVRVVESGLRELTQPTDAVAAFARDHEQGWGVLLDRLNARAVTVASAR